MNNLKPVVTVNWLEQCWIEHRVVPHEPYRILPFVGLNICVTKLNPGMCSWTLFNFVFELSSNFSFFQHNFFSCIFIENEGTIWKRGITLVTFMISSYLY